MSDIPLDDRRPGLKPPRFRLSTMMWAVTLLCMLFALMGSLNPLANFALILLLLAVLAHLAGAVLGTQLRANGSTPISAEGRKIHATPRRRRPRSSDFAPPTQLGRHSPLGSATVAATIGGILFSAVLGGGWHLHSQWESATALSIALALLACGVIGGIAGFLASSFIKTTIAAVLQAKRETP